MIEVWKDDRRFYPEYWATVQTESDKDEGIRPSFVEIDSFYTDDSLAHLDPTPTKVKCIDYKKKARKRKAIKAARRKNRRR